MLFHIGCLVDSAEDHRREAEDLGLEVVMHETYGASTTDFTALLAKARSLNPDLIVGGTGGEDAVQILRQARENDVNPKAFYFTIAPVDPEFVRDPVASVTVA